MTIPDTAREKMKTVMKVWKGEITIQKAANINNTSVETIENWCKAALHGAKSALEEFS